MQNTVILILLALSLDVVNMDVQLSDCAVPYRSQCHTYTCNVNVIHDKVLLKRMTLSSKYIFTGRVFDVYSDNETRIYQVFIGRVLKGDFNDTSVDVKLKKSESTPFSKATILVQTSKAFKCRPLRVRTYAIFLIEKKSSDAPLLLKLIMEPVLLTLHNIDTIEAAIKGKST